MPKTTKSIISMQELVDQVGGNLIPFKKGDVVEVTVLEKSRNRILVDLSGLTQGIIPFKEFSADTGRLKIGDKILAYLLTVENENGLAVLSLRRADRERIWQTLKEKYEKEESLPVKVTEANRGGLIVEFTGNEGFLPVSQLTASHYPRVKGGDKDEILAKLSRLVGQELQVKVINFDQAAGKLIFSEKAAGDKNVKTANLSVGQKIKGKITGVADFGLFVSVGEVEGLVHISEVSWERVENLPQQFRVGDEIEVEVLALDSGRVSLSMKRLKPDPWTTLAAAYKPADVVKGEVTRLTPFGAFVRVGGKIDGLVHISELGEKIINPADVVEVGKTYTFKITAISPEHHKLSLSLKDVKDVKEKKEKKDKKR